MLPLVAVVATELRLIVDLAGLVAKADGVQATGLFGAAPPTLQTLSHKYIITYSLDGRISGDLLWMMRSKFSWVGERSLGPGITTVGDGIFNARPL
jgi:hypothetical protein